VHDWCVGIDAAVAQKGPVAAGVFEDAQIDLSDEDVLFVMRRLGDCCAAGGSVATPMAPYAALAP